MQKELKQYHPHMTWQAKLARSKNAMIKTPLKNDLGFLGSGKLISQHLQSSHVPTQKTPNMQKSPFSNTSKKSFVKYRIIKMGRHPPKRLKNMFSYRHRPPSELFGLVHSDPFQHYRAGPRKRYKVLSHKAQLTN